MKTRSDSERIARALSPAAKLKRKGDTRRAFRRIGRRIVTGEPPVFTTVAGLAWWEAMTPMQRLGAVMDSGCFSGDAIYRWHQRAGRLAQGMGPA